MSTGLLVSGALLVRLPREPSCLGWVVSLADEPPAHVTAQQVVILAQQPGA